MTPRNLDCVLDMPSSEGVVLRNFDEDAPYIHPPWPLYDEYQAIEVAWEVHHYTEDDIAEMFDLSLQRQVWSRAHDTRHLVVPDDENVADVQGFLGEWAVADALGRERPKSVGVDDHFDVDGPDGDVARRVFVRYTPNRRGRLMVPRTQTIGAPWMVVTTAAREGRMVPVGEGEVCTAVAVVAGVDKPTFRRNAPLRVLSGGPTYFLWFFELEPWVTFREKL